MGQDLLTLITFTKHAVQYLLALTGAIQYSDQILNKNWSDLKADAFMQIFY